MTATVLEFSTRAPLRFVPLPLEVEPAIWLLNREQTVARIIAMAKAMAAHIPVEQQDEAYRDGLRALGGER